jgi:hypothetical protein
MNFLQDHIALCRSYLDEEVAEASDWSDSEIIRYMDAENRHLSAIVREKNEDFFGFREIFPVVSSQSEYPLPRTLAQLRWVEMITSGVSGSAPDFVVDEINREFQEIERADSLRELYFTNSVRRSRYTSSVERYRIFDNKMIFAPGTALAGHIRLWFIRTLPKLHYGTAVAAAAGTITFSATPTIGVLQNEHDIYSGSLVGIFSGLGAGQVRRVLNYDATTRVATLDDNWLVTPNTSSEYSIISPIPEQMQELIPLGGAIRATGKKHDDGSRWATLYQTILAAFKNDIDPRDRTRSRRVRRTSGL